MRALLLLTALITSVAAAQPTAAEYLAQRKRYGITETVGVQVLDKFVGAKFLEIKGAVKGTFSSPEHAGVLIERTKDDTIALEIETIPEWVFMRELPARAIIRAERTEEYGGLRCTLIAIAPAELVPDLVIKKPTPPAAKAKATAKAPSRSGGRRIPSTPLSRSAPPRSWTLPRSEVLPYYVQFVRNQNRRLSEREATRIAENIIGHCLSHGVDARLIMAIVLVESGFDPFAVSSAGAKGLGQLMPGTASDLGVSNRFNIEENVYGMVKLMRKHLETYIRQTGDSGRGMQLALAAYNAGPGAVKKYGGIPPYKQTINYVKKITSIYATLTGN